MGLACANARCGVKYQRLLVLCCFPSSVGNRSSSTTSDGQHAAKSVNRAPHGREKSRRRLHEASARRNSGRAASGRTAPPARPGYSSGPIAALAVDADDIQRECARVCRPFLSPVGGAREQAAVRRAGAGSRAPCVADGAKLPRAIRRYTPINVRPDQRRRLLFQAILLRFRAFPRRPPSSRPRSDASRPAARRRAL